MIGLLGFLVPSRLELQYTRKEREDIWGRKYITSSSVNFDIKKLILFFKNIFIFSLIFLIIIFFKIFLIDWFDLSNSERNLGDLFMIGTIIFSYFMRYRIFKSKL